MRLLILFLAAALSLPAGEIIEEIVAKVNGDVITKSDLERERQALLAETQQRFPGNAMQANAAFAEREKELLSELINRQLILQRGKDLNLNVEIEAIKRLDKYRETLGLKTLDELEKAIVDQGGNYEDLKTNVKNQIIQQQVIGREVGGRIQVPQDRIKKFYEENKEKFNRPEQVRLREVFVSSENKEGAELEAAEKKANDLLEKIKKGGNFGEIVEQHSEGATAKERGGDLGFFSRGSLPKETEDLVFALKKGDTTGLVRTKFGWHIYRIEEKHTAGIPPLAEVEQEIQERIYVEEMQPKMADYMAKLREDAYIEVKAGYTDSGRSEKQQDFARLVPQDMTEDELIAPKGKKGRRSFLPPFRRKN